MNADGMLSLEMRDWLGALVTHIDLTVCALGLAMLVALPAGCLLRRSRRWSDVCLRVLGVVYTIPSMAVFAMLVPLTGLGMRSALIALVIYAQFILLRSVLLGFRSVDPALIEAGAGMGMSPWQLFTRVELPLALPLMLAGLRLTAMTIISMAALAAWINAGGLGKLLFQGIYQNQWPQVLIGATLMLTLAWTFNAFLSSLEHTALLRARGEGSVLES